jgi:lipopolysaccharide transport system ATP-binding protein
MSAILVENLSKRYVINHAPRHDTLRASLSHGLKGWWTRLSDPAARAVTQEEFWALRDVSFEVRQGDVVGIVGRNGAGKSTLLKILSQITEPTSGRARIRGRIASLLEVGTGFNPELTGRENIFLNGSILGMTRAEIRNKFDEIVAFAEVERFLDTPVKRYSSGMYVRLAFAIAAHLDPEILIVDEVLAVGDAAFQKKCLGKMEDVASHGRTVIFVSHDLASVSRLCRKGILLKDGRIDRQGDISEVIKGYLQTVLAATGTIDLHERTDRTGTGAARFRSIELFSGTSEQPATTFEVGARFTLRIALDVHQSFGAAQLSAVVTTREGLPVFNLESVNEGVEWLTQPGRFRFEISLSRLDLVPGSYSVDLWVGDKKRTRVDYVRSATSFEVIQAADQNRDLYLDRRDGLVFTRSQWRWQPC